MSWVIFGLLLCLCSANSLKILGVFPPAIYSHYVFANSLMKELANRGHNVTFITPFPEKERVENLRTIQLTGFIEEWIDMLKNNKPFSNHNRPVILSIIALSQMGHLAVNKAFSHENVQELLKSDETFDVVLVEQFASDGLIAFAHHFRAPSVLVSSIGPSSWTNHQLGNPEIISYMPSVFLEPPIHRSFFKRTLNFLVHVFQKLYDHYYFYPKQNQIIQKYLPNSPHISHMIYNTSLVLLNSDMALTPAVPMVPNMVEIGGIHVEPPKKLPEDLQNILDDAKDGVVYFSMGSVLRSKDMPQELREGIIRALSKLKEIVLWKFEGDLPGKPSNVIIRKWFPQSDVLAHPNVKLFITHGGLLSTMESAYRGVPILGIPVFGDQRMNVMNTVNRGRALMILYADLSEETLSKALEELLDNPKYANSARGLSEIINDKLVKPGDIAEFWIEYVVRHKGAKHLRSAALELTWYQYASLDVILFLTFLTAVLFFIFYKIIRWLLGKKTPPKQKIN